MATPSNTIQLVISFVPGSTQGVQVSGPLADKMLCYALLEMAKDAIRAIEPSKIATPLIQIPDNFRKQ